MKQSVKRILVALAALHLLAAPTLAVATGGGGSGTGDKPNPIKSSQGLPTR